jgi:hypothetical protein
MAAHLNAGVDRVLNGDCPTAGVPLAVATPVLRGHTPLAVRNAIDMQCVAYREERLYTHAPPRKTPYVRPLQRVSHRDAMQWVTYMEGWLYTHAPPCKTRHRYAACFVQGGMLTHRADGHVARRLRAYGDMIYTNTRRSSSCQIRYAMHMRLTSWTVCVHVPSLSGAPYTTQIHESCRYTDAILVKRAVHNACVLYREGGQCVLYREGGRTVCHR